MSGPYNRNRRDDVLKSPQQQARDTVNAARTVSRMTQGDRIHTSLLAALQLEHADARKAGIPESVLPTIHGQMGAKDVQDAMRRINLLRGRPAGTVIAAPAPARPAITANPARPQLGTPQSPLESLLSPVTRAITAPPPAPGPLAPAGAAGAPQAAPRTPLDALGEMMTKNGKLQPGQRVVRTGGGLQVAATNPDGSPMTNSVGMNAGEPRYVSFQPSAEEAATARFGDAWAKGTPQQRRALLQANPAQHPQGQVIDTGVKHVGSRGEQQIETANGPVIEYQPGLDRMLSPLGKGDPLLPKGSAGGITIPQKYGGGVASVSTGKPGSPASSGRIIDETGDRTKDFSAGGKYAGISTLDGFAPQPVKPAAPPAPKVLAPIPTTPAEIASRLPKGQIAADPFAPLSPSAPVPASPDKLTGAAGIYGFGPKGPGAAPKINPPVVPAPAPIAAPPVPPVVDPEEEKRRRTPGNAADYRGMAFSGMF